MDIDFVELEHREDITNIMEICGINLETAYHLYHRHNFNLQAAISEKLGLVSPNRATPQHQPREMNSEIYGMSFDEEGDPEFQSYCRFVEQGKPFFKKYPIKTEINVEKKNGKKQTAENLSFKRDLDVYVGQKVNLKIEAGKIEDGLLWSWKEKFPISILILDFEQSCEQSVKVLLTNDSFVYEMGTYFKVYGFNPSSYQLQPWLNPFIDLSKDINSLHVFRVNFLDDVEIVAKVKLANSVDDIRTRLQKAKSQAIHRELDQAHLIKQHALMRKGIKYHRPKPIKDKIKSREDNRLRRQQDEQFMKACKVKGKDGKSLLQTSQKKPQISAEQLKQMRQEKRKLLAEHTEGLHLKMRMPSGKNYQLLVKAEEAVQYLFDYVDSCPDEIGFEKDHKRNFDIIYGPEKNKSLKGAKETKAGEVLEEYQLLIVKQIDQ